MRSSGGRGEERLWFGADFPAAANQSRDAGVDARCAEKIKNRFGRRVGWRAAGGAFHCRHECAGIEEDLELFIFVHGREPRARSASAVPDIGVARGLGLERPVSRMSGAS